MLFLADRIVVFGGHSGQASNDLWEYDLATAEWEMKVRPALAMELDAGNEF